MTFRANLDIGRHGWLRLTPAYGVRVVRERLASLPARSIVFDPFSGTGTTPLVAAELGHFGCSVDINPFLVWLGNTKLTSFSDREVRRTKRVAQNLVNETFDMESADGLWQPNLFKIEKWWSLGALRALKVLRAGIDNEGGGLRDLLDVAFCRTLIACSNAAFNHQSMSFKTELPEAELFDVDDYSIVMSEYLSNVELICETALVPFEGTGRVVLGDSRTLGLELDEVDYVVTSPPYVNRMSYIRELRPYMYWLRYLDQPQDSGELDWQAIGGTWGTATSKVASWSPESISPVDSEMEAVCQSIAADGGKNGPLLANYVRKYHHDMWQHFQAVTRVLKRGGRISYIVGNSTFYGHEVPAQKWYADMLNEIGYKKVKVETIRKRNSNRRLFEYDVTGVRA